MTTQIATQDATAGQPTLLTRPVLLADQGSEDASVARRVAFDLAAPSGLPLHIVTAWEWPYAQAVTMLGSFPADARDVYEQSARAAQDEVRRQLLTLGATAVTGHVVEGHAADVIVQAADSIDAALIVIGSHGRGPAASRILGSVADGLINSGGRPVLVVRGDATSWPPTAVIIGDSPVTDGVLAARSGAHLASVLGVPVSLVRAVDKADISPVEAARGELLARAARTRRETGIAVATEVASGDPAKAVLDLAGRSTPPALITVGHGHHRLGLGSVAAAILHHATGPVLVVPDAAIER
jgi:nucleotide-binding universal stress UspA family protein